MNAIINTVSALSSRSVAVRRAEPTQAPEEVSLDGVLQCRRMRKALCV